MPLLPPSFFSLSFSLCPRTNCWKVTAPLATYSQRGRCWRGRMTRGCPHLSTFSACGRPPLLTTVYVFSWRRCRCDNPPPSIPFTLPQSGVSFGLVVVASYVCWELAAAAALFSGQRSIDFVYDFVVQFFAKNNNHERLSMAQQQQQQQQQVRRRGEKRRDNTIIATNYYDGEGGGRGGDWWRNGTAGHRFQGIHFCTLL